MKRFRHTKGAMLFAAGTFGALVVGGVAYAAIPDSGGVIHACYDIAGSKPSGQMRIIDTEAGATCGRNEQSLSFNQTGPQGPQGIQGDPGADGVDGVDGIDGTDGTDGIDGEPGPAGPAGTSDLWRATGSIAGTSVSVPAGNYLVVAQALLFNGDGAPQEARCSLQGQDVVIARLDGFGNGASSTTLPIIDAITVASPGTITVTCGGFGIEGNGFSGRDITLTATKVTNLH